MVICSSVLDRERRIPCSTPTFPLGVIPARQPQQLQPTTEGGLLRWCLVLLQGTSEHSSRPCACQHQVGCSDAVLLETSSQEDCCKGTFSAEGDNKKGSWEQCIGTADCADLLPKNDFQLLPWQFTSACIHAPTVHEQLWQPQASTAQTLRLKLALKLHAKFQVKQYNIHFFPLKCGQPRALLRPRKASFYCRCTGTRPCAFPRSHVQEGWPSATVSVVPFQQAGGQARTGTEQAWAQTSRHPKRQSWCIYH